MRLITSYILLFLVQVVVLNKLDLIMYLQPQLFILILISLPPYLNKSVQVLVAFLVGLAADMFIYTPGLHASACLLLILLRLFFVSRMDMDEIIANHAPINFRTTGWTSYLVLTGVLVLFYHLYVFALQSIGAVNVVNYFLTVLISSIATYTIILLIQFLYNSN